MQTFPNYRSKKSCVELHTLASSQCIHEDRLHLLTSFWLWITGQYSIHSCYLCMWHFYYSFHLRWYGNSLNQDCKALQRVVRLAEHISGSALPSLQDIYLKRCKSRATKILKDPNHPGNHLFCLLPSGKSFRSMIAKTERLRRSFFPQAIRLLNTNIYKTHLLTVKHSLFSSSVLLLHVYTRYNPFAHPSCTSLFILLFIKSQYTVLHILFVLHFLFYCTFYSLFLFIFVPIFIYICSCVTFI